MGRLKIGAGAGEQPRGRRGCPEDELRCWELFQSEK